MISEKLFSFLLSEEILVIRYILVSCHYNCMENISELTECNVLFNNEHLILLIDTKLDLKITLSILNPENHQVY